MLNLKSFHIVLLALAIIVTAGFGTWGLLNNYMLAGAISLLVSVVLVVYWAYFAATSEQIHD
jgi:hypothetical protein